MADAAVTVTPNPLKVGDNFVVEGTDFDTMQATTLEIYQEAEEGGLAVTLDLTTDGGGAFTTDGVADLAVSLDTPVDIKADDGTTVVTARVMVMQSS